jgi:F-type H+-transporting ATPase subunit beta
VTLPDGDEAREERRGHVRAVRDAAFDVEFPAGALPAVGTCVQTTIPAEGGAAWNLAGEVALHLDARSVRVAAVDSTGGLRRGEAVRALAEAPALGVGLELLGRVLDPRGAVRDGGDPVAPRARRALYAVPSALPDAPRTTEVLWTGIKVVDLFAPVRRAGAVALQAAPQAGMLVVLMELCHRAATSWQGASVLAAGGTRTRALRELVAELRDTSGAGLAAPLGDTVAVLAAPAGAPPLARLRAAWAALALAEHLRDAGGRNVLLCLYEAARFAEAGKALDATLEGARGAAAWVAQRTTTGGVFEARRGAAGEHWITAVHASLVPDEGAAPPFDGCDSRVVLSRELAEMGTYPAVDPLRSRSALLTPEVVGGRHCAVAAEALGLLARYRALGETIARVGLDELARADRQTVARARKLQCFLTQPFFVAEQYTGMPGRAVTIEDTLAGCEAILTGAADDLEERCFFYVGTFADARAKTKR